MALATGSRLRTGRAGFFVLGKTAHPSEAAWCRCPTNSSNGQNVDPGFRYRWTGSFIFAAGSSARIPFSDTRRALRNWDGNLPVGRYCAARPLPPVPAAAGTTGAGVVPSGPAKPGGPAHALPARCGRGNGSICTPSAPAGISFRALSVRPYQRRGRCAGGRRHAPLPGAALPGRGHGLPADEYLSGRRTGFARLHRGRH